jgi:fructokinase
MDTLTRIGIDLGGTKIELVALDASGRARIRRRVDTPAADYGAIVEAIGSLVESAERELGHAASVGVATPGALSRATGLLRNSNTTCLNGRALKEDLAKRLGREVRMANDANCFALSEATDGAGAGAEVVFGVILGTGVGGGIVIDGRVWAGPQHIAGEWGHHVIDPQGPPCYCGQRGCVESLIAGPAVQRHYRLQSGVEAAFGASQLDVALEYANRAIKAKPEARYYKQRAAILRRLERFTDAQADLSSAQQLEKEGSR